MATTDKTADNQEEVEAPEKPRLELDVKITTAGPCKKHVAVKVNRADVQRYYDDTVKQHVANVAIPGFRVGHVPKKLVEKRFHEELAAEVKQRLLLESMEQISENEELDPINEPELDIESIDIPEQGDFEYEFDVEVRPEFDLPNYSGLSIERPVRKISDEDLDAYVDSVLSQYGVLVPQDKPIEPGDQISASIETEHDGRKLLEVADYSLRVRPTLRFTDAELKDFDKLMRGAVVGDERNATVKVSTEAEEVELRAEKVNVRFKVLDVKRWEKTELGKDLLQRLGVESEAMFRDDLRANLERRVTFEQREAVRQQVLNKITESAGWELPEQLVRRQVENALRRTVLEMRQSGFTTREIQARENELRQNALTSTRQALKEHFILDKIAEKENIEVMPSDIDMEIRLMAAQSGENPRRVRARLEKSGMIENLEAQIRERKAVDIILSGAKYKDVPMEFSLDLKVEPVPFSVCKNTVATESGSEEAEPEKEVAAK